MEEPVCARLTDHDPFRDLATALLDGSGDSNQGRDARLLTWLAAR
ncbi:MAG: hypothetical protein OXN89_15505 [Bryobacterales bacterium]|nr:hypothetical protein [Bryobacterales bacterium]